MGQTGKRRIIVLTLCLLLTSVVVYRQSASGDARSRPPLKEAFAEIPGWVNLGANPLDAKIVAALALDDYLFGSYAQGEQTVSLYVGYYHTAKKVGAAHDPLVCFQGQGWKIPWVEKGAVTLKAGEKEVIPCSMMTAERDLDKTFILYWFQAFDQTEPDTFRQKITLLKKKFMNQGEDNAFVRLSMPIRGRTDAECKRILADFVQSFYPLFFDYVTGRVHEGKKPLSLAGVHK